MTHEIEILEYSYWEHFKYAKDLALILPLNHPKRNRLDLELNKMISKLHLLKQNLTQE
jgi:hypothetical protein